MEKGVHDPCYWALLTLLAYRICSIKHRGVYFVFSVSDAAFIQGRRLFEGGVCFEITFLKLLTTVTLNRFFKYYVKRF